MQSTLLYKRQRHYQFIQSISITFQLLPIVVEAVGKRDVWGKNADIAATNLCAVEALAYINRSYMVYVGEHRISVDRLSRTSAAEGEYLCTRTSPTIYQGTQMETSTFLLFHFRAEHHP